jgi:LysM repeat protein
MNINPVSNSNGAQVASAANENFDSAQQIEAQFGDTPESLAAANGITPQAFQEANPNMTAVVYPGQTLQLPKAEANDVTSTGLTLGAQPTLLAGNPGRETIGIGPAIVDKAGDHNFNRIQVYNSTNTPALTKLNEKLDNIYQTHYVKPMKVAIESFKTATGTTGGLTSFAATVSRLIFGGRAGVAGVATGGAANAAAGITGGTTLKNQVENITQDYLGRVNQELRTAGYPPVDKL